MPKKISFVNWLALRSKLPIDNNIQAVGINLVSRCNCCMEPSYETTDHVLSTGDLAKEVWRFFVGACIIPFSETSCWKGKMVSWWTKASQDVHIWGCYVGTCGELDV